MSGSNHLRIVDLRDIVPRIRHTIIFQLLENLRPGSSLEILNDHDPGMLRQQIEFRFGRRLGWTYKEEGPDVWCVQISARP